MQEEILRTLREILIEHQIVSDADLTLNPETRLIDELGLDSIGMLELITAVEEHFDITIEFEELDVEVLNGAGSLAFLVAQKCEHSTVIGT